MQQPAKRSFLRKFFGKIYFRIRRYLYWNFSGVKFSSEKKLENLDYEVIHHQSLLLRKLKNVEMWMQHNKVKNLGIAIRKLDGLIIKPGETFSYWRLIGEPKLRDGYLPGMILDQGKFKAGIGGGLCQLSNLIYWMVLHSPLTVAERWRHSYDVFPDSQRVLPFGSGATCSYPNIDLQFRNDTENLFQLRFKLTETHLEGRLLSKYPPKVFYKIEERNQHFKQEWWGGYTRNNELIQMGFDSETKRKVSEKLVAKNQAIMMYDPLLEKSTKDKSA